MNKHAPLVGLFALLGVASITACNGLSGVRDFGFGGDGGATTSTTTTSVTTTTSSTTTTTSSTTTTESATTSACVPSTCADLKATCGSHDDGCGHTISCDDEAPNGTETDVDCGGPSCAPCAAGRACKVNDDCADEHCVDGVCCKTDCADQGASACGTNGKCDAAGECQFYANGTTCEPSSCQADGFHPSSTCLDKACVAGTPLGCGAFNCNASTGCEATCAADADCQSGAFCESSVCIPKKGIGQACSGNHQCSAGICVEGVCCDSGCGSACMSCTLPGLVGHCSPIKAGQVDDVPTNACNNNGKLACDGAGGCKKAVASACTSSAECAAGNCVDGVCCSSTCSTACRSCNLPGAVGQCKPIPAQGHDNYPVGACVALDNKSCNGAGVCLGLPGAKCTSGSGCYSGTCVNNMVCL